MTQAAAYVKSKNHLTPIADPGPDEPVLGKPPKVIEPGPEVIERGPEVVEPGTPLSDLDHGLYFDEYEAYQPGVTAGYAEGYQPAGGGCATCGPAPGGRWGPGDFFGGPRHPYFAPVLDRLYVRGEALLWWVEGFHVPALVTSSTAADPQLGFAGAIGDAETTVLFGGRRLDAESYSGGRINFGYWLDPWKVASIEATVFGLEKETTNFGATSSGTPILTRPFFDIRTPAQAAWPVAFENVTDGQVFSGAVAVNATTELFGTEVLLRRALTRRRNSRLDLLAGYRFARLDDSLRISQTSTALADNPLVAPGTTLDLFDEFGTWNRFHGAEIGVVSQVHGYRWSLETLLKVAFGSTHSFVRISGAAETTAPGGGPVGNNGGLWAQTTNMRQFSRREFTMIPELGVTLGYDLTRRLRFTLGYSLFYWSKVARPGEQIDTDLDLARSGGVPTLPAVPPEPAPGATHPEFRFHTTDLWAQGLSFGLDYRF